MGRHYARDAMKWDVSLEYKYGKLIGIDEVGRGCLAGPVVSCAVVMPSNSFIQGVRDSKRLSSKKIEHPPDPADCDRDRLRNRGTGRNRSNRYPAGGAANDAACGGVFGRKLPYALSYCVRLRDRPFTDSADGCHSRG